jgi:hypothetical protein
VETALAGGISHVRIPFQESLAGAEAGPAAPDSHTES